MRTPCKMCPTRLRMISEIGRYESSRSESKRISNSRKMHDAASTNRLSEVMAIRRNWWTQSLTVMMTTMIWWIWQCYRTRSRWCRKTRSKHRNSRTLNSRISSRRPTTPGTTIVCHKQSNLSPVCFRTATRLQLNRWMARLRILWIWVAQCSKEISILELWAKATEVE